MRAADIPWHVFMGALKQQDSSELEGWLERWSFADGGVWAKVGRMAQWRDLVRARNTRERSKKDPSLVRIDLCAAVRETHPVVSKAERQTQVTRGQRLRRVINFMEHLEWGICERCVGGGEARYRAFTDAMDMKVCTSCAEEARRLGILVEELKLGEDRKTELAAQIKSILPDRRSGNLG